MFHMRLAFLIALVPALALAGCGKPATPPAPPPPSDEGSKAGAKAKEELASTGWGTLKGKVTFDGDPAARKSLQEEINKQNDKGHCSMGDTDEQSWKIGPDKGVANVVVWLRAPAGKYFKIPDDQKERTDEVKIDQPFCAFEPHVSVMYPSYFDGKSKMQKETGQKVKIHNSAPIVHNTNWSGNDAILNPGANPILQPKGELLIAPLATKPKDSGGEQVLTFKCNIHTWMNAYARVFDHPFAAVTSGDAKDAKEFGTYEIKNVPAGAELEIVFWHESMGTGKPKGEKITLKEGENTKDFTIKK